MSVAWAPRARMAVKASWPGVSRNVILPCPVSTWYAPMCCVMPPNSCSVTRVFRMVSRSDVFPWSTCPMTVTTGGRSWSWLGSIASSTRSRSSADRMSASKPNRTATAFTLSASSGWLIVAITPMPTSSRMTSPIFLPIRSASSETVTDSGSRRTSRGPASAAGAAAAAAAGFSNSGAAGGAGGAAGAGFSTAAAGATTRSGSAGAGSSRRGLIGTTFPSVAGLGASATFGSGSVGAASRAAGTTGSLGRTGRGRRCRRRPLVDRGRRLRGGRPLDRRRPDGRRLDRTGGNRAGCCHRSGGRRDDVPGGRGLLHLRWCGRGRRLRLGDHRSRRPPSRPPSPWWAPCPSRSRSTPWPPRQPSSPGSSRLSRPRPWPPRSSPVARLHARSRSARTPCGHTRPPGRPAPPEASAAERPRWRSRSSAPCSPCHGDGR